MTSRTPLRGPLVALLALAAVALAGVPAAQAVPHPDNRPTYPVTADLDGRTEPERGEEAIAEEDFLRKGRRVRVICQAAGERIYGSRLWDMVSAGGDTYYVPDRYIRTGTDGRAEEIRRCTGKDDDKVTRPPSPYPPNHP